MSLRSRMIQVLSVVGSRFLCVSRANVGASCSPGLRLPPAALDLIRAGDAEVLQQKKSPRL